MTDDLVKRLYIAVNQFYGTHPCGLLKEAADRIEELERLFLLALNLRAKQKVYFRTRSKDDLIASKQAEKDFDDDAIPTWFTKDKKKDD